MLYIDKTAVLILLAASLLLFASALFVLLFYNTLTKKHRLGTGGQVFVISALLLLSVWCLRFMVGISGMFGEDTLFGFQEVVNSFVHALQSFSMDEDYTQYILLGKQLMSSLCGDGAAEFYGVYASVLNIACPIAGGALLFSLIAGVFPAVRLFFRSLLFWRPVFYFSKLNDASLALAEDIAADSKKHGRPTLVFADVSETNGDDGSVSELMSKAVRCGCICLKSDILHLPAYRFNRITFILSDFDECQNLKTLAGFGNVRRFRTVDANDRIAFFCQSDSYVPIERSLRAKLAKASGEDNIPRLIPVRGYSNLVKNLLVDHPLYETLDRTAGAPLNVTLMGIGGIGIEMFKAVYWCGQMLDHPLCINVVSRESEEEFKERIDNINPDILQTADPDSSLLDVYPDGRGTKIPYCKIRYRSADLVNGDTQRVMEHCFDDGFRLCDSDYYFVALGSDEQNLDVADRVRRYAETAALVNTENRASVAFVIYDDMLASSLDDTDENGVHMFTVGSLSEVYSYSNVFMVGGYSSTAGKISDTYNEIVLKTAVSSSHKRQKDEYTYWANIARAIHMGYKAFCVGADSYAEYSDMIRSGRIDGKLADRMAWLEHRRWCAFMRTQGFRCPTLDQEEAYIAKTGSHKSLSLKLHPCLVECSERGIDKDLLQNDPADDDMLDALTRRMSRHPEVKPYEYKLYDYPDIELLLEKTDYKRDGDSATKAKR